MFMACTATEAMYMLSRGLAPLGDFVALYLLRGVVCPQGFDGSHSQSMFLGLTGFRAVSGPLNPASQHTLFHALREWREGGVV